jgi:hypothetical protein
MMNSVSLAENDSFEIVNSIRLEDNTPGANCLYTYNDTIRSTMIHKMTTDFYMKNKSMKDLKLNDLAFSHSNDETDQFDLRSVLA